MALESPGPDVTKTTTGRSEARLCSVAMNPAPDSWRLCTTLSPCRVAAAVKRPMAAPVTP